MSRLGVLLVCDLYTSDRTVIRLPPSPEEVLVVLVIRFMEASRPFALGYAEALTLVLCFVAMS